MSRGTRRGWAVGGAHCLEGVQLFAISIWLCSYSAFYRNSSVHSHSMSEYGSGRFEIFFAFGSISELGKVLVWLMWLPSCRMGIFGELKAKKHSEEYLVCIQSCRFSEKQHTNTSLLCSKRTPLDFSGTTGEFTFPRRNADKLLLTYKSLA